MCGPGIDLGEPATGTSSSVRPHALQKRASSRFHVAQARQII